MGGSKETVTNWIAWLSLKGDFSKNKNYRGLFEVSWKYMSLFVKNSTTSTLSSSMGGPSNEI